MDDQKDLINQAVNRLGIGIALFYLLLFVSLALWKSITTQTNNTKNYIMSYHNEKDLERQDLEERIKDLEADLYESIPFKRSQAHVYGDDQAWIDKWEKEVETELERIR